MFKYAGSKDITLDINQVNQSEESLKRSKFALNLKDQNQAFRLLRVNSSLSDVEPSLLEIQRSTKLIRLKSFEASKLCYKE